jgi:hypothetical protein
MNAPHNLKTTLAGLLPAIAVVAYAAGGYFLGHIDGPVAIGLVATALGIGGVGAMAKDAREAEIRLERPRHEAEDDPR